jgi:hypothetical protein
MSKIREIQLAEEKYSLGDKLNVVLAMSTKDAITMERCAFIDGYTTRCKEGFEGLLHDHAYWSANTFPMGTATGALLHASRELEEVREEIHPADGKPFCKQTAAAEYADLIFCIMDSARRAGITMDDITKAGTEKLKRNIQRQWRYNGDGSYSHVKKRVKDRHPVTLELLDVE